MGCTHKSAWPKTLRIQHLKGAARGVQWDSDISSDSVDIVDRSRKRSPMGCLLEKTGRLPEQEDFSSYPSVGTKGPKDPRRTPCCPSKSTQAGIFLTLASFSWEPPSCLRATKPK